VIEGESLASRLARQGRLDIRQLAAICASTARALHEIHRAGVAHRALGPGRIYLVRDPHEPTGERVELLDVGLAAIADAPPPYRAPEQWRDPAKVDWRVDAYALGCIAFELAVGRPPFVGASLHETQAMHMTEVAPMLRSFEVDAPAPLEALIAWLLQKDPAARPPSMAHVAAAFAALPDALPSTDRDPQRSPWADRKPSRWATIGIIATCLGLIAVATPLAIVRARGQDPGIALSIAKRAIASPPTVVVGDVVVPRRQ
jgi:serine/threonine protein kinase